MSKEYEELVNHLSNALKCAKELGLGNGLAKGKIGEIMLANYLGHKLELGDKGADGVDNNGFRFEYKVSHDNQFNFNFGHARPEGEIEQLVDKHFEGLSGAYCGLMHEGKLMKIVFCPIEGITSFLKDHLRKVKGKTFQKRFDPIEEFMNKVDGAEWILKTDFHIDSAPRRAAKAQKI
ncbi:hypothetical protein [Vibrio harveyi]|uniref:hypothetical protein n=1 Tax=Vibrio harveyi TaxID=669 RepID=UPI0040689BAF